MPTAAEYTVMKMMESLPESIQERVVEHMQRYIDEIRDEFLWKETMENSKNNLIASARQVREEIRKNGATPMNLEDL